MTARLRIGTRRSALALAQTRSVDTSLRSLFPSLEVDVVPMSTSGDQHSSATVSSDFTDTIDQALLDGDVDAAVHSAKDLPAGPRPGLVVAAYPRREDPRETFVGGSRTKLESLAPGARVGSSSSRRRAQLLRLRPDVEVVELRGNVDTRILRVREGALDGVILAWAGLRRLGRQGEATEVFPTRAMLPAPAQGALAIETRARDLRLRRLLRSLDDPRTRATVTTERGVVEAMGGDCTVPLAALATMSRRELRLRVEVYSRDGADRVATSLSGPSDAPAVLARRAARALERQGARALWTPRGEVSS